MVQTVRIILAPFLKTRGSGLLRIASRVFEGYRLNAL